jgi:hypothetical protein
MKANGSDGVDTHETPNGTCSWLAGVACVARGVAWCDALSREAGYLLKRVVLRVQLVVRARIVRWVGTSEARVVRKGCGVRLGFNDGDVDVAMAPLDQHHGLLRACDPDHSSCQRGASP